MCGARSCPAVQSLMPSRPVFFQFGVATYHWLSTILRQLKSVNVYVAVAWCEHTLQLRYRATCIPCCHIRPNSPLLISLAFYLTILFIHYVPTSRKFLLGQLRRRRRRWRRRRVVVVVVLNFWLAAPPPCLRILLLCREHLPPSKEDSQTRSLPPFGRRPPPFLRRPPPPLRKKTPPIPTLSMRSGRPRNGSLWRAGEALGRVAMGYVTVCWSWDVMGWKGEVMGFNRMYIVGFCAIHTHTYIYIVGCWLLVVGCRLSFVVEY